MSLSPPFDVRFSAQALGDLERLFDFLLERVETIEDLDHAQAVVGELRATCVGSLGKSPFSYRKCASIPLRRELIIPLGATGYVAQYEIEPALLRVVVIAVRHQREDDYH